MDIYLVHDDHGTIVAGGLSKRIISGEVKLAPTPGRHFHVIQVPHVDPDQMHAYFAKVVKEHRVHVEASGAKLIPK